MIKVQVIRRETIKPSSPTPPHLRRFQLSSIDQMFVSNPNPLYVPIILFFSDNVGRTRNESLEISHKLKSSLSKTLTHFYPLAGRIKDNCSVDCNDDGIDFSEACIDGQLSEFLQKPYLEMLTQMVPNTFTHSRSGNKDVLLAVQVNIFDCGGMAVGVCISHKVGDAMTLATFIKGWATISSGSHRLVGPKFESSSLLPPREENIQSLVFPYKGNSVTKMFVFTPSKISALRSRSTGDPTRVEAVSALIWRCFMRTQRKVGSNNIFIAHHAVNLRRRLAPPLSECSFGNIIGMCLIPYLIEGEWPDEVQWQCDLERKLKDAIRKVDCDNLLEYGRNLRALHMNYPNRSIDTCYFTSWCRFSLYEVDFGWGDPVWVSSGCIPLENTVVLMDTRSGDGIEAWVNMEDELLVKFEQDEELLSFASPPIVH